MKNKKMLITLLLAIALVVLCGTTSKADTATSEDGKITWDFKKDTNTKQITNLKCSNVSAVSGEITVPEKITIDGVEYTVMSLSCDAFEGASLITKVTIPENIGILTDTGTWAGTTVGSEGVFKDCTSLTEVVLPKMSRINIQMFSGCTSLQTVKIPEGVIEIGLKAFYNCSNLKKITLPSSVTVIKGDAFKNCTSLGTINIPDNVTSIGGSAFENCTSLDAVTIPDSVTSIGACAFENCKSMKSLKISNSITELPRYVFSKCASLTEVTIPDSVVRIQSDSFAEGAFAYCEALQKVTIPDSVTSIGRYAFYECGKGKLGLFIKQGSYAEEWAKTNNVSYKYGTGTTDDNKENQNDNKEEENKSQENKDQESKENKVTLTGTDKTTATKVISKTGESAIVLVTIALIAGIAIFVSRKLMSMKDIK